MSRRYTDAEKIAYYKRKAQGSVASRRAYKPRQYRSVRKPAIRQNYKYPGLGRKIGGSLGSMVGNYAVPGVGGVVGGALGSVVGEGAQALVKKISGFGDYNISKNSLVYNSDAVPEFSVNNERCTMVSHREFITDVLSSGTFSSQTFRINPAIATTFPWLASIAANYEQYVVQGMVFEFKTTSATAVASTNTGLGTVVMATQYNSLAPNFQNKQQMENYEFSQSSVPCQSILHPVECDPTQTQCGGIFNMWDANNTSGDTRLYDIGRFTIASVGQQATGIPIGELWVSYKICFLKPRLQAVEDVMDIWQLEASSIAPSTPLGDLADAVPSAYNSGICTLDLGTVNNIIIDPTFVGVLQIIVSYELSALTTDFRAPIVVKVSGNLDICSTEYTGIPQSAGDSSGLVAPFIGYTIGYVRCRGGYTTVGALNRIAISTMSAAGYTFSSGYLSCMSVPDNMLTDPFP